ncbi:MAG: hypothetical protein MZW92_64115 [Comamonadaceae bacterium]|nr:hypothetical protein [Comamonadaceae bacterium]
MGQFKHPSGEEAMKEPPQQEFVNSTDTTNQLLGERFFASDGTPPRDSNLDSGNLERHSATSASRCSTPSRWASGSTPTPSCSGQGNGILQSDNNSDKDLYLLWASEWVFGGQGAKREGLQGIRLLPERRAQAAHRAEAGRRRLRPHPLGPGRDLQEGPLVRGGGICRGGGDDPQRHHLRRGAGHPEQQRPAGGTLPDAARGQRRRLQPHGRVRDPAQLGGIRTLRPPQPRHRYGDQRAPLRDRGACRHATTSPRTSTSSAATNGVISTPRALPTALCPTPASTPSMTGWPCRVYWTFF